MQVCKRDSTFEEVSFDKVVKRLKNLVGDNLHHVNVFELAQKVCARIYNGVKTSELDELAAHLCSSMIVEHPEYGILASRIIISNHQKNTSPSFSETIHILYNHCDDHGTHTPLVSKILYKVVEKHKEKFNSHIDYSRDYEFDYFGFKTLERAYLLRIKDKIVERPQHMFMRVAIGIHGWDVREALQTYDCLSKKMFMHATPTLFNSGTPRPQNSSCFLLANHDSIDGIFETLKECALISKYAGGIGLHCSEIRAKGSTIRGTNGMSDGIVPMLRVFNNVARYVNQCFTPDTLVVSETGNIRMDSVKKGDKLLTLDGTFKSVNEVIVNDIIDKKILHISIGTDYPVRVTPEHDVYIKSELDYWRKGRFVPASQIKDGDFVGFPKVSQKSDGYVDKSEAEVEMYILIGLLMRYGTYNTSFDNFEMSIPVADISKLDCMDIVSKTSRVSSIVRYTESIIYNVAFSDALKELIFVQDDVIFIRNSAQLALPCINALLNIVYDVENDSFFVNHKPNDKSMATEQNNMLDFLVMVENESMDWHEVVSIEAANYTGQVYDFNMIDNHNYTVTNLGLVHNSGRRNGSIAIYLEPWHADIMQFLELKRPHGADEERARDLFYALWIPDLFMERVKTNGVWSLMCPDKCPGLTEVWGEAFETLYKQYEDEKRYSKQVQAQELWFKILEAQIESGTPYLCYKDAANRKSNQQNLGTIKCSNLCSEIIEYTSNEEIAVCNLNSLCLPSYLNKETNEFDFKLLHEMVEIATKNLNKVIDVNFYPHEKARVSNLRHRPLGIGIQGMADLFAMMKIPFESEQAKTLNREIFETIYHAALTSSNAIAMRRHNDIKYADSNRNEYDPPLDSKYPGAYSSFEGSPASKGQLQFDLWTSGTDMISSNLRYDWAELKESIQKYGLRNSLLLAPMPTASTSQICGFNESFEPFTSNIYKRKTMAGEFILVNKYLLAELVSKGLWSQDLKNAIIMNDGSIQNIDIIPQDLKELFKTVWEIKQKCMIDMAADRGVFVCQSQSLNLFMESPDFQKLSSMHFYAWSKGLKTGMYYLRSKAKAKTQQFTIDPNFGKQRVAIPQPQPTSAEVVGAVCIRGDPNCESCSA